MLNLILNFSPQCCVCRIRYKLRLWQALDAELNRDEINREFAAALEENWSFNADVSEEQVNADIEAGFGRGSFHDARYESFLIPMCW